MDLKRDGYNVNAMYGFGTPRVGDTAFEDAFHQELALIDTERVFATDNHGARDAVTMIPLTSFALPVVSSLSIATNYSCSSFNLKKTAECIKGLHSSYKTVIPTLSGVAIASSGFSVQAVAQKATATAKSFFSRFF